MLKRCVSAVFTAAVVLSVVGLAEARAANLNHLLKGDYAFSGSATCLNSPGGFDPDLTPADFPAPFPTVTTFSLQGVRTFNGDGTGTAVARSVFVNHPFALPTPTPTFNRGSAGSSDVQSAFTYEVGPDHTITIETPVVNGMTLTGPSAGQTFTITDLPVFSGSVSKNFCTLTIQHDAPGVETVVNSGGGVQQRICARARILFKLKSCK